ncbi:MAG: hypothetical protein DDT18_00047 [Actinobacteria bacterium]|nr:hypothetical protein [Actinomycetota bacterium]
MLVKAVLETMIANGATKVPYLPLVRIITPTYNHDGLKLE